MALSKNVPMDVSKPRPLKLMAPAQNALLVITNEHRIVVDDGRRTAFAREALEIGAVIDRHVLDLRRVPQINRRSQHFHDRAAAALHALRSRFDFHPFAYLRDTSRLQ